MIAIVRICYRNYPHYKLYRSCLLIYGIAIIRLLSFLFLDDFNGNANISVAIKSGSTVAPERWEHLKIQFHLELSQLGFGSFLTCIVEMQVGECSICQNTGQDVYSIEGNL